MTGVARWAHLPAEAIILLILGVYATVYAQSDAPPVGLTAITLVRLVAEGRRPASRSDREQEPRPTRDPADVVPL